MDTSLAGRGTLKRTTLVKPQLWQVIGLILLCGWSAFLFSSFSIPNTSPHANCLRLLKNRLFDFGDNDFYLQRLVIYKLGSLLNIASKQSYLCNSYTFL